MANETPPSHSAATAGTDSTFNEVEELFLLQMAVANNEPLSPQFQAVMATQDTTPPTNKPAERRPSPLLMERPRSSGLDISAFSFAKPAEGRKPFTLQASTKPSSSTAALHNTTTQHEHGTGEPLIEATRSLPGHKLGPHRSRNSTLGDLAPRLLTMACMVRVLKRLWCLMQTSCLWMPNTGPFHHPISQAPAVSRADNHGPPLGDEHSAPKPMHAAQGLIPQLQISEASEMAQTYPVGPGSEKYRVSKRRRSSKTRHSRNVRPTRIPSGDDGSSLSEESLFHLLIGRIKAREENEAAAVELKEQMEACISGLADENKALKSQLAVSDKAIRKRTFELGAYKSQVNAWQSKISNIKGFVNQLGSDFQTLRSDANRLLAAKKSAHAERTDIDKSIDDAKAQVAKASEAASKGREQLLRSESQVDLLKQALSATEEKTRYVRGQLSDEKKRTRLLEQYIQECSRSQEPKLSQIRADQLAILKRFEAVFHTLGSQQQLSQNATQQTIGPSLNKCVTTLDSLCGKVASNNSSVKDCMDGVKGEISRMGGELIQLHDLTKECRASDGGCITNLNEQLQKVTSQIASESTLAEQISMHTEHFGGLKEALERLLPLTDQLNCSIDALRDNQARLCGQMEQFEADLGEARTLKNAEAAALELTRHELEKAQIEGRMQKVVAESEAMAEKLRAKDLENKAIQSSLLKAESRTQEIESCVIKLEAEVVTLKDAVNQKESQVREELGRASVIAREQIKARYEQQHRDLLKEKADLAQSVELLQMQLDDTKSSFVRCPFPLDSKTKEVEELTCRESETVTKLAEQEQELKRLAEQTALAEARSICLQDQIEETKKALALEDDLVNTCDEKHKIQTELQHKLDALLQDNMEKQEECRRIQERLTAVLAERADLESSKLKTKDEIHTLLKRVQDSEAWVNKLKELLRRAGLAAATDSLTEIWSKFEVTLLSTAGIAVESRHECRANPVEEESFSASSGGLLPQEDMEKPQHVNSKLTSVATTVPDSQTTTCLSPARRSDGISNDEASVDSMCLLGSAIVPFSSIQPQSPRTECLFSSNDSYDLAAMLIITPECGAVAGSSAVAELAANCCTSSPKRTGQDLIEGQQNSPSKSSPKAASAKNDGSPRRGERAPTVLKLNLSSGNRKPGDNRAKHRSVTFETEVPAPQKGKRKLHDMETAHSQGSSADSLDEDNSMRSRRTYSKQQQQSTTRVQAKSRGQVASASQEDMAHEVTEAGTPRSIMNKRTRVSFDTFKTTSQTKTVTEYFDRKSSPEKLASGSSRPALNDSQTGFQKKPTRGGRGGGRKTRGE
ncbi:hypothetical protein BO99DRAFT_338461 [Aspergillus violaceofuscus CBS 115571]|uniref:Rootletin n=1 Tax=Aspergillus violaceofuscus (strain CBS 115571) TaxID=1450538 RepID=A0A2V5H8A4_ASPV1|nr:hypothetical protein BO99DRAFT_338461 [Aspergillus violaceofuscus CBS 115571]